MALRDWAKLPREELGGLRSFCVHYAIGRAPPPPPFVRKQVAALAVLLLKRGWADETHAQRAEFFGQARSWPTEAISSTAAPLNFPPARWRLPQLRQVRLGEPHRWICWLVRSPHLYS